MKLTGKIVLGLVAALALLLGGFWLWVSSAADRRREDLKADVQRRSQAAARRIDVREPLSGDPVPGNAWDDYKAATALIEVDPQTSDLLSSFLLHEQGLDRARAKAKIQLLQPALDLLHRGVRRAEAQAPVPPPRMHLLKMLAEARAEIDIDEGRTLQAFEGLLDFVRCAQDSSFNTTLSELPGPLGHMEHIYEKLQRAAMKGGFPPEAAAELERRLEVLDRTTPPFAPLLENHLVWLGDWIQKDPRDYIERGPAQHWRYAFHPGLEATASYFDIASRLPLLADVDRMTWTEEREAFVEFDRRGRPNSDWAHTAWLPRLRQNRARLRLLRMVLHRRRTGAWPDLDDPFGVKLSHAESATHLRAWSAGPDGVDNGGKGSWAPRDGEDLLLEVPK